MESEKNRTKKKGAFSYLADALADRGGESRPLRHLASVIALAVGFLFGGCHVVFGAYPLGLALVAALPSGVWFALIGVGVGSLLIGKSGIIYAMTATLVVFLRVIISGGGKAETQASVAEEQNKLGAKKILPQSAAMFTDSIGVRMCCATIGAFVAGVYEMLIQGFSLTTLAFAVSMVALSAVITTLLSGLFCADISLGDLLFGKRNIFARREGITKEFLDLAFFRVSALAYLFFVSFALSKYNIFGVDLSLVFSAAVTLFAAKRFGALYGMACGFISACGKSALYSVSFALLGVGAGALFNFGVFYAIFGGGFLLCLWGVYAGGITGFLSVFPEYAIASVSMIPLSKFFNRENEPAVSTKLKRQATDMVGTMALAYRNERRDFTKQIEDAAAKLSSMLKHFSLTGDSTEDFYSFFAKLIGEARAAADECREIDSELCCALEKVFVECGFADGVIKAFGKREKYFICAGEDNDGTLITSKELRVGIEEAAGVKISEPEYYRRDNMVLMECHAKEKYSISYAYSTAAGDSGEVSGDSIKIFKTPDRYFYALISDGMGSGEVAKSASSFVCEYLYATLPIQASKSTLFGMLNGTMRRCGEEFAATVDLFELDLLSGDAHFVKSGAVASYIKRGESLFRIRSERLPIGVLKNIDAERIGADIKAGDIIIMLSDGISQSAEESAWLLELLSAKVPENLKEFTDGIVSSAKENIRRRDDMTALAVRITEAQ